MPQSVKAHARGLRNFSVGGRADRNRWLASWIIALCGHSATAIPIAQTLRPCEVLAADLFEPVAVVSS